MSENAAQREDHSKHSLRAGYAALFLVFILVIVKSFAYFAGNSASILSSLTDSLMDGMVSLMALGSVYYARRPADADHRWGHGKMEAVSALMQAAIILGGGMFLVFESVNRLINPPEVSAHTIGIGVMVISIILSIILVSYQRYVLSKRESLAIEADRLHYGSDVIINLGVIAVLAAIHFGAPLWVDPLFCFFVALYMAKLVKDIALKALAVLTDREIPEEERSKIIAIIESDPRVLGWHDLRTRNTGEGIIIAFDIEAEGSQSLTQAHDIAVSLEYALLAVFSSAEVLIHIDPKGFTHDARHRVVGVHL